MTRTPLNLAALASAAVSGLDPVAVAPMSTASAAPYDAAVVTDAAGRRWVVRAPHSAAGAAELDAASAVVTLLARRLSFGMPVPAGFATLPEGGRAVVHAKLGGGGINLEELGQEDPLVVGIGQALAEIHNLDPALLESAGLETYTADEYRQRHLSDLDRAAASGRVPAALLSRWERALENVAIWQFAPTPIHGGIDGRHLLVVVDGSAARLAGVTGWRRAKVADPADDFAALVDEAPTAAVESVFEAYVAGRTESPDPHLQRRARLAGELRLVRRLLAASTAGSSELVRAYAGQLRRLDERVDPHDLDPPAPVVVAPKPVLVPASPAAAPAGGSPGAPEPIGAADTAGAAHPTWPAGPAGPAGASEPAERHTTPVTRARTIEDEALGQTQPLAPGDLVDELPENSTVTEELPLHRGGPHDRRGAPG